MQRRNQMNRGNQRYSDGNSLSQDILAFQQKQLMMNVAQGLLPPPNLPLSSGIKPLMSGLLPTSQTGSLSSGLLPTPSLLTSSTLMSSTSNTSNRNSNYSSQLNDLLGSHLGSRLSGSSDLRDTHLSSSKFSSGLLDRPSQSGGRTDSRDDYRRKRPYEDDKSSWTKGFNSDSRNERDDFSKKTKFSSDNWNRDQNKSSSFSSKSTPWSSSSRDDKNGSWGGSTVLDKAFGRDQSANQSGKFNQSSNQGFNSSLWDTNERKGIQNNSRNSGSSNLGSNFLYPDPKDQQNAPNIWTRLERKGNQQNEYDKRRAEREREETLRKEREEILRKEQEELLKKEREEKLRKEKEEQLKKEREERLRKEREERERLRKQRQEEAMRKKQAELLRRQQEEMLRKQQEEILLRRQQEELLLRKQQEEMLIRAQQEELYLRKQQEEKELYLMMLKAKQQTEMDEKLGYIDSQLAQLDNRMLQISSEKQIPDLWGNLPGSMIEKKDDLRAKLLGKREMAKSSIRESSNESSNTWGEDMLIIRPISKSYILKRQDVSKLKDQLSEHIHKLLGENELNVQPRIKGTAIVGHGWLLIHCHDKETLDWLLKWNPPPTAKEKRNLVLRKASDAIRTTVISVTIRNVKSVPFSDLQSQIIFQNPHLDSAAWVKGTDNKEVTSGTKVTFIVDRACLKLLEKNNNQVFYDVNLHNVAIVQHKPIISIKFDH